MNKPARACISDCYVLSLDQIKGTCVSVKVEGGVIATGDKLALMPLNAVCVVKGIMLHEQKVEYTKAGDNAEIAIQTEEDVDSTIIKGGMVLASLEHCIRPVKSFRAQIVTLEIETPITPGYQVFVHCYSLKVPAKIARLEKTIVGATEKKRPKYCPRV